MDFLGHMGMIAEDGLGRNEIMMRKNQISLKTSNIFEDQGRWIGVKVEGTTIRAGNGYPIASAIRYGEPQRRTQSSQKTMFFSILVAEDHNISLRQKQQGNRE